MKGSLLLSLAVNRLERIKAREKLLLTEVLREPGDLKGLSRRGAEALIGRRFSGDWNPREALEWAARDLDRCRRCGIQIIRHWDEGYPPQLREIYDPPFLLFLRGKQPSWDTPSLAVVGTRFPTGEGRREAFRVGFTMGGRGLSVVSGLALGIDVVAHRGNRLAGGATLAVMAGGLDRVYPRENHREAAAILESGGGLMGEYPPGTAPLRFHFPVRNRIISGLSRWVVIIEAPRRSGALITGDFALEQGRELFVHSLCLTSPAGEGGRDLIRQGADVWRNSVFLANERKKPVSFDAEQITVGTRTGAELARLMEEELTGRVVRFQGEVFRRRKAS